MHDPIFKHCGNCGSPSIQYDGLKEYSCSDCGWHYFTNAAAAVAGVLEIDGKVLLTRRAIDPGKGKLDLPGGFIDPGERAEEALTRELEEELGIRVTDFTYVGTWTNRYTYADITYNTLDVVYRAALEKKPEPIDRREIATLELIRVGDIDLDAVAFASIRDALRFLKQASQDS